ncbi:MAG: glucose-1-phosphate adenylyltransferase [Chthoniobacterales bacterium]
MKSSNPKTPPSDRTLAIIMGGGVGSRLFPLTWERAKPAVPLGGKYRLVDIPISNCLNSGIRGMYVLTQFNSTSLHRHINSVYKFDNFSDSFVEILAAQQTPEASRWYQGTADAVRQNLRYFLERDYDYFVILSGDQLYRMDYRDIIHSHIETKAEITIATIPVDRQAAQGFGIMQTDDKGRISRFVEKPKEATVLDSLQIPKSLCEKIGVDTSLDLYQASMGIYVFNRKVLEECLDNNFEDFGKDIIPMAIEERSVYAYIFQGYWEDIGTIAAFFRANLNLTEDTPPYTFYETGFPVYTHARFLPASVIRRATVDRAIISDGCDIRDAVIEHSVIGVRSTIGSGSTIKNTIMMGADFFEESRHSKPEDSPPMGIGNNCQIDHVIIDKNARIGHNVIITPEGKKEDVDMGSYYIRDGIVVIPKNSVIPDNTRI